MRNENGGCGADIWKSMEMKYSAAVVVAAWHLRKIFLWALFIVTNWFLITVKSFCQLAAKTQLTQIFL